MKRKLLLFTLIVFISIPLTAEEFSDIYGEAGRILDNFLDKNKGRTAFPTLLIPMGGRYEGLGTAYTAVSSDSSYIESNPAASASLEFTELSFLHNDWIADSKLEGIVYTIRFKDVGIGLGGKFLYVPFSERNAWGEQISKGYYSENIAVANVSYNLLSNYYFHGIAVGMNTKLAYRHVPANIVEDQSAVTVMTDIGFLTRFDFLKFYYARDRNFSVGATIKNLGFPALGDPLPTRIRGGLAYSPFRPILLTFDTIYPIVIPYDPDSQEALSFSSGLEVTFSNFFSAHMGTLIEKGKPRISLGGSVDIEQLTIITNYTLDMTTQINNLGDRFSIETKLNLGDRGRKERFQKAEEHYLNGLEAYANGNFDEAISYWKAAISVYPEYTPARESLNMVMRSIQLQEEMEEKQKIE